MDYEPRVGVDYIVDYYQVAAVPKDAEPDVIKLALNERLREYHPDRLQGVAPEFRAKGEWMGKLLTEARAVLLDDTKRSEYDQILDAWEGPISKDGTPIITIGDATRQEALLKTPEELEAGFVKYTQSATAMVGYNPKQQSLMEKMYARAEPDERDEVRDAYEEALLAEDRLLALIESERGQLLGLPQNKRDETMIGYGNKVAGAIETARTALAEDYQRRQLGGVGVRLALLAGKTPPETSTELVVGTEVPHYFDEQAKIIVEIADKREELLEKRLAIFMPNWPIAELQTIGHPDFVMGVGSEDKPEHFTWVGFHFDEDNVDLSSLEIPDDVKGMLKDGRYEDVYNAGFNVATFQMKDQIELMTLLEEAYNKHLAKFFPDTM